MFARFAGLGMYQCGSVGSKCWPCVATRYYKTYRMVQSWSVKRLPASSKTKTGKEVCFGHACRLWFLAVLECWRQALLSPPLCLLAILCSCLLALASIRVGVLCPSPILCGAAWLESRLGPGSLSFSVPSSNVEVCVPREVPRLGNRTIFDGVRDLFSHSAMSEANYQAGS